MERLFFTTSINANTERVWEVLWSDNGYRQWTRAFAEGSHAVTDWNEGSKVLFLAPGGEGMVSKIAKKVPNKFMSFEHLGFVKDGVEDTTSEAAKSFTGALENYTLTENNGSTDVRVDLDMTDEYKDYFIEVWPKALERLKALAEEK
jgi:uncharacterized protein YndB with AHSA1/START domain